MLALFSTVVDCSQHNLVSKRLVDEVTRAPNLLLLLLSSLLLMGTSGDCTKRRQAEAHFGQLESDSPKRQAKKRESETLS